jgi:hypothetical protein
MATTKGAAKKPAQPSATFKRLCKKYGVDHTIVPEILSFEAACKATGDNPAKLPIVKGIAIRHQKRITSDYQLSIIADALRKMENVNYNDTSLAKYHAVFAVKADAKRPSGFGLSFDDCGRWHSGSDVGVRLCFHNRDTAIFFGKHFLKLHTDHHLLT